LDFDFPENEDLKALAKVLADWANGHDCFQFYLFGSRVRGDHRSDSDVDVVVRWFEPGAESCNWWDQQIDSGFEIINQLLPGKLQILEYSDPISEAVLAASAKPILTDRNVLCVWLPPKPRLESS
jgi:hypothetical protein